MKDFASIRQVKKYKQKGLDFIVDKLTNSFENIQTGEVFNTTIIRLTSVDINLLRKMNWRFDWLHEIKDKTKELTN